MTFGNCSICGRPRPCTVERNELDDIEPNDKETNVNLNETVRLFILNLPEILELRNEILELRNARPLVDDAIAVAVRDAVGDAVDDLDMDGAIERGLDNYDLTYAIENAFAYGGVDVTGNIDGSDLDIGSNGAITAIEERLDSIESALDNIIERLDNASISI